jgi:hypothetical protein
MVVLTLAAALAEQVLLRCTIHILWIAEVMSSTFGAVQ